MSPHLASMVMGIEPRASCMLGKHFRNEAAMLQLLDPPLLWDSE